MKRNIGDIDAIVRIMVAFVLAYCYYVEATPNTWQSLGLILAGLLMLTAVHGTSPLYRLFGLKSICKNKNCCFKTKKCESKCETTCDKECCDVEK